MNTFFAFSAATTLIASFIFPAIFSQQHAAAVTDHITGFLLRPGYVNMQSLTDMYKKYANYNDVIFNGLFTKYASQLQGFKVTAYVSLADIQTYAPILRSKGIHIIGYDLEKAFSPTSDLTNPIAYTQRAAYIAHNNGLLFMALPGYPSGRDTNYARSIAPYTDYYVIQAQPATNDPPTYQKFVTMMASAIHSGSPYTKVITQMNANMGTVPQMEQDYIYVASIVDGVVVGMATDTPVSTLDAFYSWLDANYGA